jgi:hypothetical protein
LNKAVAAADEVMSSEFALYSTGKPDEDYLTFSIFGARDGE